MTDQSVGGSGKFAGILLLLQGLLLILFVVFVGYSDDLLPEDAAEKAEHDTTGDSKYSGKCLLKLEFGVLDAFFIVVLTILSLSNSKDS